MSIITQMGDLFNECVGHGRSERKALAHAFLETHRDRDGLPIDIGSRELRRRLSEYIRRTIRLIEMVRREHFRPFRYRLAIHNQVTNCRDPIRLLKMGIKNPGPHASQLERRGHFEARRSLAIAMQMFVLEDVDPEFWVSEDLAAIEDLSWERLFVPGVSRGIWVAASLDAERNYRTSRIMLSLSRRRLSKHRKELSATGAQVREELFECRMVQIKQTKFYVYAVDRGKLLFSTLLKLERGRAMMDRRGWKYVVIGVQGRKASIRPATREHAEQLLEHCRESLWQHPLHEEKDVSADNPFSAEDYWDCRVLGRLYRPHNGRIVAGTAEQLVTTIQDHLDDQHARDQRNHEVYRHRQVLKTIAPLWFPHSRANFKGIPSVRLPGYNVNWTSDHVQKKLHDWWLSQL